MQATYVEFPGTTRKVEVPNTNGTSTLGRFLEAAGKPYDREKDKDVQLAVDGQPVDDLETLVRDGATVTRTKRVEGA
jgi:hypothetical protein